MKKHLLIIAITLFSFIASAQVIDKFKLTPNGFINSSDSSKNYVVIDIPQEKQQALYKKSMIYFSGLYVSPKEVISSIDNESITINGVAKNAFKMKVLYLNPSWDVNYTFNVLFKDGKIKISQPSINRMITRTGSIIRTASVNPGQGQYNKEIFNRKGVLKQEDGKANLEDMINNYVISYVNALKSTKEDNW